MRLQALAGVMAAPMGYPPRSDIVTVYVKTLAMALGSEEGATRSIYSVSTKYYYAFGCRVPELWTYKIKSLPDVKWVLSDSFIANGENGYRGELFVDGEVLPYDEKYHADWLRDQNDENANERAVKKKPRRKRKKNSKVWIFGRFRRLEASCHINVASQPGSCPCVSPILANTRQRMEGWVGG